MPFPEPACHPRATAPPGSGPLPVAPAFAFSAACARDAARRFGDGVGRSGRRIPFWLRRHGERRGRLLFRLDRVRDGFLRDLLDRFGGNSPGATRLLTHGLRLGLAPRRLGHWTDRRSRTATERRSGAPGVDQRDAQQQGGAFGGQSHIQQNQDQDRVQPQRENQGGRSRRARSAARVLHRVPSPHSNPRPHARKRSPPWLGSAPTSGFFPAKDRPPQRASLVRSIRQVSWLGDLSPPPLPIPVSRDSGSGGLVPPHSCGAAGVSHPSSLFIPAGNLISTEPVPGAQSAVKAHRTPLSRV